MTASKVWLVTGASSGLGTAIALAALRAGHKVIACARTPEKAAKDHPDVESLGGRWLQLDVNASNTQEVVQEVVEAEGRLDVVVNNAGFAMAGSIEDLSVEEIQSNMETTFYGAIRVIKGALPSMRAHGSGTIVNMSSIFAQMPSIALLAYNSAKCALEGLSETLAIELAPFGIRMIILEPGTFKTNIATACKAASNGTSDHYLQSDPYSETFKMIGGMMQDPDETMLGDPDKLGDRVIEYVDGTGMAKGLDRKFIRLPLGPDAIHQCKVKAKMLSDNFAATEKIAMSTNYERHGTKASEWVMR